MSHPLTLLSLQGAHTSVQTVRMLNDYYKTDIEIIGYLPTQVNARLQVTASVSSTLVDLSKKTGVPVLPAIRVDQTVHKASGSGKLLLDYDPLCKAAEDYRTVFEQITTQLEESEHKHEPTTQKA